MTVPADVAARTLRLATELPVADDDNAVWRAGHEGGWYLYFYGFHAPLGPRWWLMGPMRRIARHRTFATWDEVRVALDEVEERGSWWAE